MKYIVIFIIIGNLIFSYLIIKYIYLFLQKQNQLDHPNQRSLHTTPKLRGGGIAIICCYALYITIIYIFVYISLKVFLSQIAGCLILGTIGWLDDKRGMSAKIRLFAQIISVILALFLFNGFTFINIVDKKINIGLLGNLFFIFYSIWMINLYNFMDGIDGIAISQLIIPSFFIALIFGYFQNNEIGYAALIMICSSIFFYKYNWPPSKMFIGDVLSGFLGYYFAVITLYMNNELNLSFFIIPVLMAVFIFDSTVTLLKRLFQKEKIWVAHNNHYYQKFAKIYGHKKVTIAVIIIDIFLFIPGYLIIKFQFLDFYITILTYLMLAAVIKFLENKYYLPYSKNI